MQAERRGGSMDALSTQVASRKFAVTRKGYDPAKVDAYLTKVGDLVAKLEDELRVARSRIDALERQSRDVRDADTVVKTAFLAAAEAKSKLMAEAEAKAASIIAEAEHKAERIAASTAVEAAGDEASLLLLQAKQHLEDSERRATERRMEAEHEAMAIIDDARSRASAGTAPGTEVAEAADELQKLMETLGALKETARDGLEQVASIEADIDAAAPEPHAGIAADVSPSETRS